MNTLLGESPIAAFMPHGHCYLWQPELIWLHALSDSAIALAYYSIPLVILYLVRRRRDLPFPAIFLMFGAFIVACGTTHLMEVITTWQPVYWLSGGIKAVTAAVSIATAVALIRVVPRALELPGPDDLRRLNASLEEHVRARTADLSAANESLRQEAAQREQAEAEVRRLNVELQSRLGELQTLFQLLPVGVSIATEPTCRRLRVNRAYAEMHGLPVLDESGSFSSPPHETLKTCRLLHDGRELRPEELPMARAVATNEPVRNFEKTLVRKDGTAIEILANAVPLRDDAGAPRGCVAIFLDITAHKQAERRRFDFERKLQQSQKLESIGVLAGGVAHDFNNLLTGILGHNSLARLQLAQRAPDVDPLLAEVELAGQRAAELCRQLLAYAGKGRFIVKLIDLNLTVNEARTLLKLSISKKVNLELQLGDGLPPIRGDATQIKQVLMNLVINGSEAIGDGVGTVTLRTHRVTLAPMDLLTLAAGCEVEPGNYVCLSVEDTGCGLTPEAMPHLFEPFFTTKFVGRGLGLAAVLGIVQGHRGAMRVTSQVGAGTTFELFLPVAPAPAAATAESPAHSSGTGTRGTVLIVDDEESVRSFAAAALRDAGFTAITANDGEDALAQIERDATNFDAVLLDLTMPRLGGEDALIALRMVAPDLPVVLTSGYHEQGHAQRFVGRGPVDFLPKPFDSKTLVTTIGSAIERARERGNQT